MFAVELCIHAWDLPTTTIKAKANICIVTINVIKIEPKLVGSMTNSIFKALIIITPFFLHCFILYFSKTLMDVGMEIIQVLGLML